MAAPVPEGLTENLEAAKMAPDGPGQPQTAQDSPQDAPRAHQMPPRGSKRLPGGSQEASSAPPGGRHLAKTYANDSFCPFAFSSSMGSWGFKAAPKRPPGDSKTHPKICREAPPTLGDPHEAPKKSHDASKCPSRPNLGALPSIFRRGSRSPDSPATAPNLEAPPWDPAPHERKRCPRGRPLPPFPGLYHPQRLRSRLEPKRARSARAWF